LYISSFGPSSADVQPNMLDNVFCDLSKLSPTALRGFSGGPLLILEIGINVQYRSKSIALLWQAVSIKSPYFFSYIQSSKSILSCMSPPHACKLLRTNHNPAILDQQIALHVVLNGYKVVYMHVGGHARKKQTKSASSSCIGGATVLSIIES
jgi:hypothetical protein